MTLVVNPSFYRGYVPLFFSATTSLDMKSCGTHEGAWLSFHYIKYSMPFPLGRALLPMILLTSPYVSSASSVGIERFGKYRKWEFRFWGMIETTESLVVKESTSARILTHGSEPRPNTNRSAVLPSKSTVSTSRQSSSAHKSSAKAFSSA